MSIINDALKKANIKRNITGQEPVGYVGVERRAKRKHFNWAPLFLFVVFAVITGPIIAPVFSTPFRHADALQMQSQTKTVADNGAIVSNGSVSANRKGQFGMEEMPMQSMPMPAISTGNLNLSGIVYSPNNSYAIINGQVVKKGGVVGRARLVDVTASEAILDLNGDQVVLTTN